MDSRKTDAIKQILMEDDSDDDSQPSKRDKTEHELFGSLDMREPDEEEDLFKSVLVNRKELNDEFKYTATEKYSPKINRQKAKADRYAASVMIKVNEVEEEKETPTANLKPGVTFVAGDRNKLGKKAIDQLRKEKEFGATHDTLMSRDSLFQSFQEKIGDGYDAKDLARNISMSSSEDSFDNDRKSTMRDASEMEMIKEAEMKEKRVLQQL